MDSGTHLVALHKMARTGKVKPFWVLLMIGALGIVVYANVQLVTVAIKSQPDCVPHEKTVGSPGRYRAAKPSC